jgi:hypothetical protein
MDNNKAPFKPPYNSFRTFWGFIDTLAEKPLPPQLDRSMFDGKSGSDQMGLNFALQGFGLIASDEDKRAVEAPLRELVSADAEGRKAILAGLLNAHYPEQVRLASENATEDMLLNSFKDGFNYTGETRRKAATWFLHAMTEAGLPVSPHFPKPRPGGTQVTGSRQRRQPRKKAVSSATPEGRSTESSGGDEFTVKLGAGGTVTLRVNVSHFALSRHKEDRQFVQGLLDALTEYEQGAPPPTDETDEPEGGDA